MKFAAKLVGMTALMLLISVSLSAQKPADMVGTWSGLATLEGEDAPNELALVLELKEGKLAGHMTDQYGTMNQTPISEITLDQGTLSFSLTTAGPGGAQVTVKFKMKVSGDAMKGELVIPEMAAKGTWEAAKRK
jgi:hypothetical protein